jgi:hypothetical protein
MLDLILIEWVTKMKSGSNSVEYHPQLSHNRHPVDGELVGAGSTCWMSQLYYWNLGHGQEQYKHSKVV